MENAQDMLSKWASVVPEIPPKGYYSLGSYGGGTLARAPFRKRRKRLAKKIRRRMYFLRCNKIARVVAGSVWRDSQLEPWERMQKLAFMPPVYALIEEFGEAKS